MPILIGVMSGVFDTYLALKGLKKIVEINMGSALLIGLACGVLAYAISYPVIRRASIGMENRNKSVKVLFGLPLVFSAALLSFAHGANDVANAVGPLAAIVHASEFGGFEAKVSIPMWVMVIGAFGISFGLFLFGPKLIRMVGSQITKLNPMRAYCVALSAAITVIIASWGISRTFSPRLIDSVATNPRPSSLKYSNFIFCSGSFMISASHASNSSLEHDPISLGRRSFESEEDVVVVSVGVVVRASTVSSSVD